MKNVTRLKSVSRVHVEMIKAVVSFALAPENLMVTKSISAFDAVINKLKNNLENLSALEKITSSPVTGYAIEKKALKNTLVDFSAAILLSVTAYDRNTGDEILYKKVKTSTSTLSGMKYEDLLNYVGSTIDTVNSTLDLLANYNINATTIVLWKAHLKRLNDVISNPKNEHARKNAMKKSGRQILVESMNVLYGEGDLIALQFKAENVSYYNEYNYNRKLIPLSRHTKLKVKVTNEVNDPMVNVVVTQTGTDNSVKTNLQGEASLRIKVAEGREPLYNFMLSKEGWVKETGLMEIKKGETVSSNMVMAPTGFVLPLPDEERALAEK